MGFIVGIFEKTFAEHPYFFLSIILLTGGSITHSYNVFAQKVSVKAELDAYQATNAVKFDDIEEKISTLEHNVMFMFSRQAVMNYSSEIHTLTELDKAGKANGRDRQRLRSLKMALDAELLKQNQVENHDETSPHILTR